MMTERDLRSTTVFASTLICWRSMLAAARRDEERRTFRMKSHSPADQRIFDSRLQRLARTGWRAVRVTPLAARQV
jgi:hypothetical protein